ncbi:MAG: beta-propeller domain-containing protein [Bacillota bacterium]
MDLGMYRMMGAIVVFVLALTLAVGKLPGTAQVQPETPKLPAVASCTELAALLDEKRDVNYGFPLRMDAKVMMEDQAAMESAAPGAPPVARDRGAGSDYSTTNIQVEGVDEADIVKTDGRYIFQVNNKRVMVIRAYPHGELAVKKVIQFSDQWFHPREIYLDAEHLVVVGTSARPGRAVYPHHPYPIYGTVKTMVFDVRDKDDITRVREVELDGNYVSSRKIGKNVYLVANKYPDYYMFREAGLPVKEGLTPAYRDSLAGDGFVNVDCTDVCYFPGFWQPNYLLMAGFSLNEEKEVEIGTYLGAGENIYASRENLYVAATERHYGPVVPMPMPGGREPAPAVEPDRAPLVMPPFEPREPREQTTVYRFALKDGDVTYTGKGEVPGTILNQFSMDEYDGHFRVATTLNTWGRDSRNALYVLDRDLGICGRVEDIAPGERIYSARFMGKRVYMVTFKTTDPLFVLDLADPKNPAILGALKIPGFSNYLHPYDEHHLIGFGKDAVEAVGKEGGREVPLDFAYEQGMKLSLFDVTDVKNPVEKFSVGIGDRGTNSEILNNHKALWYHREKNLFAFPVTVAEIKQRTSATPQWEFGTFVFQGAYVYELTLERGFMLKGRITHLTDADYVKSGNWWPGNDRDVNRILHINDNLYTLSNGLVKVNDLNTLAEKRNLVLP